MISFDKFLTYAKSNTLFLTKQTIQYRFFRNIHKVIFLISGIPKVIFLAVVEAEGEGGKTSALEVEAEGEAEGLVFCI